MIRLLLVIALSVRALGACAHPSGNQQHDVARVDVARVDAAAPTATTAPPQWSRPPHPATQADCELIVDRNVEVRMMELGITDPASIEKRKTEIRSTLADDVKSCIGKRIADEQLQCIREAKTTQAIDQCFK